MLFLCWYQFFLHHNQIINMFVNSKTWHYTIILGTFSMEESIKSPKLLLLRSSGMLCNVLFPESKKDKSAHDIYKQLRSYAGRRSFEVRSTCGSSGSVNAETDKNLMFFLNYHKGIFPILHEDLMLWDAERYLFCNAKASPSPTMDIVVCDYSPPRERGQFVMPTPYITKFPPAEMMYLKCLAICILNSFNHNHIQQKNHQLLRLLQTWER